METAQFHPPGPPAGADRGMTGKVLEEGLRGAGGWLLNGAQERFMSAYDERGERAARDVVSRAIFTEMRAGRTSPHGGGYIRMAHLGPAMLRQLFKGMVERWVFGTGNAWIGGNCAGWQPSSLWAWCRA